MTWSIVFFIASLEWLSHSFILLYEFYPNHENILMLLDAREVVRVCSVKQRFWKLRKSDRKKQASPLLVKLQAAGNY